MTCPRCHKEVPNDQKGYRCPFCGSSATAFTWPVFLFSLLLPPLVTLLASLHNDESSAAFGLIGGIVGGIGCGVMLASRIKRTAIEFLVFGIILSVIMIAVCMMLCFFGCAIGSNGAL
jgi:hypothetical protein